MSMADVFRLEMPVTLERVDGEHIMEIRVADENVVRWSVGLCMLKEAVVESLLVRSESASVRLHLEPDLERATGRFQHDEHSYLVSLAISGVELDRWVNFFLCYVRDGYGSVDHMDVDFDVVSEPIGSGTLVLHVPQAAAPVARDEALRRLGF
jgi:hypothetical protein